MAPRAPAAPMILAAAVAAAASAAAGCATSKAATETPPAPPALASPLADAVAIRARPELSWHDIVAVPRKASFSSESRLTLSGASVERSAQPPQAPAAVPEEKLVITGAVEISNDDVAGTAAAIRAEAARRGGQVAEDQVTGERYGVRAKLQLRIPVADLRPFLDWLPSQGTIESQTLTTGDVTRQYVDQELRLRMLRAAADRLEKLLAERARTPLADVLQVEKEMNRIRQEIETLEGQHRYLVDRVARSTLDVHIRTRREAAEVGAAEQKFLLIPLATAFTFLDDRAGRHGSRLGGGVALLLGRRFTLTMDAFPARGADPRSLFVTLGAAAYSDFLGRGLRRFFNPYLGIRLGGASVNGAGAVAYGADAGIEIFRGQYLMVDLAARVMGLTYTSHDASADVVFQGTLGVGVPF